MRDNRWVWHARPLTDDDIPAVVAMVNACELADSGEVMLEAADIIADLAHADRDRDGVVIVQNGRIVGWGLVWDGRKRWADVHPDARGQGIGTWLLRWSAWRAEQLGADRIGQTIDDGRADVAAWLAANGYSPRYTSWVLSMSAAPTSSTAEPAVPPEYDAVLELFERAFNEHRDRNPVDRDRWRAMTVQREGFVPEDLIVIREDDVPVAAAFLIDADEIWVDKLAVAAPARGRGYARELLAAARRRAAEAGYERIRLSTDSNTSALEVYTRLGMTVERSYTHWAIDLST
ncbi:MAG: GNAT family N-acetyltransferase [Actinobacteria bacterium]|mgnify:CR=1 FL=1|nr:GNAT family N-acetyltransferase [Actinomycetota bacterium]